MKIASCFCLGLIVCIFVLSVQSTHLQIGTTLNAQLVYMETVRLGSIPLIRREKNVFFNENGTNNTRPIRGISAIDLVGGRASAIITAGGINLPYVNIRLRSERGQELNYQIQIYA